MKTLWTIIALTGFISISLFGLLSIHHQGGHMAECLASRLNGSSVPCPQADPLGFANFHSNALKKISNLIVVDSAGVLYVLISALLLFGLSNFLEFPRFSVRKIGFYRPELHTTSNLLPAVLAWFSIHENSPSFFRG